jgi:hypothetical protein
VRAEHVVLGIGLQGNIRKLGVPGDDLPFVQYQLDDPDEYSGETIVVVGAGDAAIENALALACQAEQRHHGQPPRRVRARQGRQPARHHARPSRDGQLECYYNAAPESVEQALDVGRNPSANDLILEVTPKGRPRSAVRSHHRAPRRQPAARLRRSCGVVFPSDGSGRRARRSARKYESNVPGLYIVGALGGYPLIKQAMNQGYEVVEYILGEQRRAGRRTAAARQVPACRVLTKVSARDRADPFQHSAVRHHHAAAAARIHARLRHPHADAGRSGGSRSTTTPTASTRIVEGHGRHPGRSRGSAGNASSSGVGEFFGEMSLISGRRRSRHGRRRRTTAC